MDPWTGNHRFQLVPNQPARLPSGQSMDAGWADYNGDGRVDLLVANGYDRGEANVLYRSNPDGTFTAVSASEAGALVSDRATTLLCTWVDYDMDGIPDVATLAGSQVRLYHNDGSGRFSRVPIPDFSANNGRWGLAWVDYDNNGFLDLMVACGDAMGFPGFLGQKSHLYRNNGNGNHWLKVRLTGTTSNRDGIGAKVRVKATIGEYLIPAEATSSAAFYRATAE